MISYYEKQYMKILERVYKHGYSDGTNERTGLATKRLPGQIIKVDVEKEFPILKSKFVAAKTAQREIEWIWKTQSNNIHDLKAKIWNEWTDADGSIGKAYGYQIAKPITIEDESNRGKFITYKNQADFVINHLKKFPNSRRVVVTLWDTEDLSEMNLTPCCHTSTWNLDGGRLNCLLDQRSGDLPYGVPFNTTQYAELMNMFAVELGVRPGILTHVIADAHIYANQMEGVEKQIALYKAMKELDKHWTVSDKFNHKCNEVCKKYPELGFTTESLQAKIKNVLAAVPTFWIKTDKSFFDYSADDCSIENYDYISKIDFGEVAV